MAEDQDIQREVARGDTPRTPFLALSAVTIAIGALFVAALAVVVVAYLLAR